MRYKQLILDTFKQLDAKDLSGFSNQLSENIEWINNKTAVYIGKAELLKGLSSYHNDVKESFHTFINVWEVDDTYILTADLSIITNDNVNFEVPWTAIVKINNESIGKVEVFSDTEERYF
jgi:hypothetical protein